MASDPIAGRRILVTRPAERAAGLAAALAAVGGEAVRVPTIEIVAQGPGADAVEAARSADVILFTSPAAVAHGIDRLGLRPDDSPPVGVVGPGTGSALCKRGFRAEVEPLGSADSEGLLRAPGLQRPRIAGRRVVIVRGRGGRRELARELMARGATVDYADVYRRERPPAPAPGVAADCDILTATSNEGLANLLAMFDDPWRSVLLTRPLAVTSARAAALARARGFEREPEVADGPDDEELVAAIRRCAADLPAARPEPGSPESGSSEPA